MPTQRLWLVSILLLLGSCLDPLYDPLDKVNKLQVCCDSSGRVSTCLCERAGCSEGVTLCAAGRCFNGNDGCPGAGGGPSDAGSGGADGGTGGAGGAGGTGGGEGPTVYTPCCPLGGNSLTTCPCVGACSFPPFIACPQARCTRVSEGEFCPP